MNDEPNIQAGVMTIARSDTPGLGELLEAAMTRAVEQAMAEGVSVFDSDEILKRKAAARAQVMREVGNVD